MDLDQIIHEVVTKHPEFTISEVYDLCQEYLSQFNNKTKESSKEKSLKKFLNKEFSLDLNTQNIGPQKGKRNFSSIPKEYFQSQKYQKSDYVLRCQNIYKQIGKTSLFEDANINIGAGEKIALVGKNGAGKSTLLNMIIGRDKPNSGDIVVLNGVKIGFLSQDIFRESQDNVVGDEMLTALPKITETMHRLQDIEKLLESSPKDSAELIKEQAELIEEMIHYDGYQKYGLQVEILNYFGFEKEHLDMKVSQLSGGEQTKVQIAKFLIQEVDLLVLDEPTNHLDIEGIVFLEEFCKRWGKTLICISHDKKFLNNVFDKVLEISHKKLFLYEGNYDSYLKQKQKNYELQEKKYKDQQKYLEQQEAFVERFRYKASKASQVQSRIKQLNKIEKVEAPENDSEVRKISFSIKKRLPQKIMEFDEFAVGYGQDVLINFPNKLVVDKKMKIGIVGKNGVGKTTLINTILGQLPAVFGGVSISADLKIGSYAQVAHDLDRSATVLDDLLGPGASQKEIRTLLGSLLITGDKVSQQIGTLSGGEKAKVALVKMLLQKPDILIMDEPTNHLDIASKDALKHMLKNFDGVSLIVSHDRDFLEGTSNLLWVIGDEKMEVFDNLEKGFGKM